MLTTLSSLIGTFLFPEITFTKLVGVVNRTFRYGVDLYVSEIISDERVVRDYDGKIQDGDRGSGSVVHEHRPWVRHVWLPRSHLGMVSEDNIFMIFFILGWLKKRIKKFVQE